MHCTTSSPSVPLGKAVQACTACPACLYLRRLQVHLTQAQVAARPGSEAEVGEGSSFCVRGRLA